MGIFIFEKEWGTKFKFGWFLFWLSWLHCGIPFPPFDGLIIEGTLTEWTLFFSFVWLSSTDLSILFTKVSNSSAQLILSSSLKAKVFLKKSFPFWEMFDFLRTWVIGTFLTVLRSYDSSLAFQGGYPWIIS